jgi:hypothetical protein
MRTPEGLDIADDLHKTMNQLEDRMTLKLGDSCDHVNDGVILAAIRFLKQMRDECQCAWNINISKWECGYVDISSTCDDIVGFNKAGFEIKLQLLKDLLTKSPDLCNFNAGQDCTAKKCDCPTKNGKSYFFEGERCYLELGEEECETGVKWNGGWEGLEAQPWHIPCRRGTICECCNVNKPKCASTSPAASGTGRSRPDPRAYTYVSDVKEKMAEFLMDQRTKLKAKLTASGMKCESGSPIMSTLADISVLLRPNPSILAGRKKNYELEAIRLMESVAEKAIDIAGRPMSSICTEKPGKSKKKDKDEHDADGEERFPPEYRGSQAKLKSEKLVIALFGTMNFLGICGF